MDAKDIANTKDESCLIIDQNITTINLLDDTIEEENNLIDLTTDFKDPRDIVVCDLTQAENINGSIIELETTSEAVDMKEVPEIMPEIDTTERIPDMNETQDTQVNLPASKPDEPEDTKLLIDIKFTNRKTYLAFQEEFVALVKNYYKSKIDDMNILDDMSSNRIRVSEKVVKKSDIFLVDKTPSMKNLKDSSDDSTPHYRKSFGKTILSDEKAVEEKLATPSRGGACFNCDRTNHSLRDCPEPRNMKKVNKARNEFSKNNSNVRYHEDAENDRTMVPGQISDELRAALGINANQIPMHVYKMREFGYPPGWFEEAKVHHSGLSLFVDKDRKQLHPGADEGEMETIDFQFDLQKFYDFPGFNVVPDNPFHDLCHLYKVPPMIPQHSKKEMIRALGDNVVNGYKKLKLRESGTIVDVTGDCESLAVIDMEIENDPDESTGITVCLTPAKPTQSSPTEPMEDGELSNDSRSRSPNEMQLAEKRKELLAEIAESSVFLDTSSINSSINITTNTSLNQSQLNATIIENSENENRDNCAKETAPESNRTGFVDSTIAGCPVLPSFSPFNTLPDGEKFQAGVCDVIAFENLAESTGKYEKMKTLIDKVRVFQKRHQVE